MYMCVYAYTDICMYIYVYFYVYVYVYIYIYIELGMYISGLMHVPIGLSVCRSI